MADEITQVQTGSPAETAGETATPETETAPVSTTLPAEAPSESTGEAAGGVEGYLKEKEAAIEAGKKKSKPDAPAKAAPEPEPSTTTEETPAEETATTTKEETQPTVTETPTDDNPPAADDDKMPERIRISGLKDGHLVAAANRIAREEGISFADAFARVAPKPAPTSDNGSPAETGKTTRSRTEVEKALAEADAERDAASVAADALEQGSQKRFLDAQKKFESLTKELQNIDKAEEDARFESEVRAQSEFSRSVTENKSKAVQYWPDAAVAESDFSKRMIELSNQYESDPRLAHHVYEADAPFFFAELVAKEMGIAPVHLQKKKQSPPPKTTPQPSTAPSANKPAAVTQRAVVRPVQPAAAPASGTARTTQEPRKPEIDVDSIKSVADYERIKKKLIPGGRKLAPI